MFFCVFLPGIMGNDVTCRGNVMEFYYRISAGTLLTYVTHLYKTSHMSQKLKLSFSYVCKGEKMGFNMVQTIFSCDN